MALNVYVRDPRTLTGARVSKAGELATGRARHDLHVPKSLTTINTAFNFYPPRSGEQFIITGIIAFADKDISDASTTVIVVYGAESELSLTVVGEALLEFGMAKLSVFPGLPLDIDVPEGLFVNAKTDDNNVHMTILGKYQSVNPS